MTEGKSKRGLQWNMYDRLKDLEFADDICLLAHKYKDIQAKLTQLHEELQKVGLSINISKTKEIRANVRNNTEIKLQDKVVERVDRFTYLGSVVTKNGGTEEDVLNRISKANTAFVQLYSIWKNKQITQRTKLRIFETNVKAILLYGCETWKITQTIVNKLQTFINRCL
jgi:hypothetical protein